MRARPKSVFLICLIALLEKSQAQEVKDGPCLDIEAMDDFDVDKFEGRWFEYAGTPLDAEEGQTCNQFVRYPPTDDQWPISLLYKKDGENYNFTRTTTITGTGKGENNDGTKITFVQVDYDAYALIYACKDQPNNSRKENVWFLTRRKYPKLLDKVNLYLYALILKPVPIEGLQKKDQSQCPKEWRNVKNLSE